LGQVNRLYEKSEKFPEFDKMKNTLGFIYTSALDLTSSCSMASERYYKPGVEKFGVLYQNHLIHRLDYYCNFFKLNDIEFTYPEYEAISSKILNLSVNCDIGLIVGVLDGLVTNAVKHANARNIQFNIRTHNSNKYISLQTKDSGIGIHPEKLKKIEDSRSSMAFSQSGGFGIVAYKIALSEVGCSLDIESIKNEGTKVTINIPIVEIA
jgi:signal transduction histidine kinase